MDWNQVVKKVAPHVVKIETPSGHGTGFLLFYNDEKTRCCIATAEHVVAHADDWKQPIKIHHLFKNETLFIPDEHRIIFRSRDTDSAVILLFKSDLQLPEVPIALLPESKFIDIGAEVGWIGFPNVAPNIPCFFSGNISALFARNQYPAYFVDGVSIHGVSGGPVLYVTGTEGVQIVGIITAYHANRATGEALPGLAIAQDLSHFHDITKQVRSYEEASRKKREFEEQQQEQSPQPEPNPDKKL